MRKVATALVAIVIMLGGCGAGDAAEPPENGDGNAQDAPAQEDPAPDDADQEEPGSDIGDQDGAGGGDAGAGQDAPDLIGIGLAAAREQAEEAGFDTQVHDATGRTRTQVLETNWRVCFQQPEPGAAGEALNLGVVKLEEDCPDSDQGAEPPELGADNELPDFSGHSLAAAMDALGRDASVLPVDATDADRNIYVEKNWRICAQDPAPGAVWSGEQITFQVVQYDEDCPG